MYSTNNKVAPYSSIDYSTQLASKVFNSLIPVAAGQKHALQT